MRILFLGRTQMLMNTIKLIEQTEHKIVGIGTCKAADEYLVTEKDFAEKASDLGVAYFCDTKINSESIQSIIKEMDPDIAISVNWLTVINTKTISLFKYGILNGHAGDLPKYRGNACPNWAILQGEKKIGFSIHFMEANNLDSGDIVKKKYMEVDSNTTIGQIYKTMEEDFPKLFIEAINEIESNGLLNVVHQSKNRKDILRCYPRIPSDSCIEWNMSCEEIDRLIRASGWPFKGAYTFFNMKKIYITKINILNYEYPSCVIHGQVVFRDCDNDEIGIAASDGVIVLREIYDINGFKLSPTELVRSTRNRMGINVSEQFVSMSARIDDLEKYINLLKNNEKG